MTQQRSNWQTNPQTNQKTALVLGATGGIGAAVTQRLQARGWRIRALHRSALAPAVRGNGTEWIAGDAMNPEQVRAAAQGVALIVHAVNPPGYRDWDKLVLPMLDNTIAAARAAQSRILLPGTVYNYGPDAFPPKAVWLTEDAPQHAGTRKGRIRVEMERRLRAAAGDGVRSLIVRAGDFFGPGAVNNWFAQGLVQPGKPVSTVTYPGKAGIGHQWAYLPDVAETMVQLVMTLGAHPDRLEPCAVFHMRGHWDADGRQMTAAIGRAAGRPALKVKAFPWWALRLGAPFVPLFREMREMRYLWQPPLCMSNVKLVRLLGCEPHTALDEAVRATLAGLGCLEAPAAAPRLAGSR